MTKEEIIEECKQRLGFETDYEMYSLCQHEKDFYNAIIKALEQQPSCNVTTEEIAQSFRADVEAVKDYLPKCNSMEFPQTFDEFANDYGFTDDKEIYTNGSHLIPVFRVRQWLDHVEQQPSEDCVSRAQAIEWIENLRQMDKCFGNYEDDYPTADVVERAKIDKAIEEIREYSMPDFEYHGCGGSQLVVETEDVIEILKRNIGE